MHHLKAVYREGNVEGEGKANNAVAKRMKTENLPTKTFATKNQTCAILEPAFSFTPDTITKAAIVLVAFTDF